MKKRRKGQRVNGYYPLLLLDPFLCLFLKAGTSGGARKPALKGKPSPRSPRPTHGERSGYSEREGLLSLPPGRESLFVPRLSGILPLGSEPPGSQTTLAPCRGRPPERRQLPSSYPERDGRRILPDPPPDNPVEDLVEGQRGPVFRLPW